MSAKIICNTKIVIFLIAIIRSMWTFYHCILPVIDVECMCCENVFESIFHSSRETRMDLRRNLQRVVKRHK